MYGKLKQKNCKTGNFPERTIGSPIPAKPGGLGPSGTHGSYKKGSPAGTAKHK